jgi:hypothetical protein
MNKRKVEVYRGEFGTLTDPNVWKQVKFKNLKRGDVFRMFEPTGELVIASGHTKFFKAVSDPYKNTHGIWTIEVGEEVSEEKK